MIADMAHATSESSTVSVTLTLDQQVTQAEITVTNASSEIQVITQDLASTSALVQQLVDGGSSNIASVSEVIALATTAVAEASNALASASAALWDAKEKQDSYEAAVAATQLANSNLTVAQSSYSQAVIDLSSISAAVTAQQQVVSQEQAELNAMQTVASNSFEVSSPSWSNSVEVSTSSSNTVTLPQMWDASTKIDVPFDIKMGNTVYEGQGSASQIYVTSKAFISFGQPDHTFWDWPQTTGIYVYQSDWMTGGTGAYTKITTTDNTLTVEWSLKRFGDSNGPLTNVVWNMVVDPSSGEWTGYSEISGNTSNLYGGPRIGVRYSNNGPLFTMSPKVIASASAELVEQQQQVVNSESVTLVNLQTQENLQTVVVQNASQSLAIATSASSNAQTIETQALTEFTQALQNTQTIASNLIVVVENAETRVQTAYVVINNSIAAEQARIAAELAAQEAARSEAARIEAERVAAEQAAQAAAAEAARLESERLAAEAAAEAARIAAEQAAIAEAARIEAERLEAARLEAERIAALEQAERERQERLAAEAEAARIEAERIAAEQAAEAARIEAERIAAEQAAEAARLEAERLEAERLAAEAAAAAEAARLEAERLEAERLEKERLAAEEAARLEAERVAAEEAAKEKARLEAEAKAKAEKLERERLAEEERKRLEEEASKPAPTPSPEPKPEPTEKPTPTEKPVVVEIKEPITAENITAVVAELATIAPQQLTQEQQTLITEAALETFKTAEQGSAEYEAALDALLVVAQADDIVLDEAIAAIPLLGDVAGAAVEIFNALGNAGADMSPQVRETSEDVIVAAVIVGQVAITATTTAATMAARRP